MDFDDIRPYRDDEVRQTLDRLINNKQLVSFAGILLGKPKFGGSFLMHHMLRKEFKGVNTISQFQAKIGPYVKQLLDKTTAGVTVSGLENIVKDKGCLLISNHRDIVLDSTVINYMLQSNGFATAQMAIGDNLLSMPWVEDFFKLNKGFIVKRGLGLKEQYKEWKILSHYIDEQVSGGHSIWMAQREGRAKDGCDSTNPAIITMLAISQRKKPVAFSDYINKLRILPVAVSYEYNPCDRLMALELYKTATNGSYSKRKGEDEKSMLRGVRGDKGRVHVSFGTPLSGDFPTPEDVAAAIDRQIHINYKLWESNYIAFEELTGENIIKISDGKRKEFHERLDKAHQKFQVYIRRMYARPVVKQLKELHR